MSELQEPHMFQPTWRLAKNKVVEYAEMFQSRGGVVELSKERREGQS